MRNRVPKLCLHRATGRGYCTDPETGREVYFGQYRSRECQEAYRAWISRFTSKRTISPDPAIESISVSHLVHDYLLFAQGYYLKNGRLTSEWHCIRQALRPLVDLFGLDPVDSLGVPAATELREQFERRGLTRKTINQAISRVKRCLRWGVEQELVSPLTLAKWQSLRPLKRGRTVARDPDDVPPVAKSIVAKTLNACSQKIRDLILLQLITGMRPSELLTMRGDQIDQEGHVWIYSPEGHKTEHLGKDRVVYLGPAAQEILKPYMRKGILFPSIGRGKNCRYRGTMTVSGYRKAIRVASQAVGVPVWKPNQLRHTALTEIRREHGLEAAQVIAGHSSADTTEIYAERDSALAKKIALLRKP